MQEQHQQQRHIVLLVPLRTDEYSGEREQQFHTLRRRLQQAPFPATVVVARQTHDGRAFNRGALLNAGYLWVTRELLPSARLASIKLILHDVDLVPSVALLATYARPLRVFELQHLAACWPRYGRRTDSGVRLKAGDYMGGVLGINALLFSAVNGFPNDFFGWGGEDDELRDRLLHVYPLMAVDRPPSDGAYSYTDLEHIDTVEGKLAHLRLQPWTKNQQKRQMRAECRMRRVRGDIADGISQLRARIWRSNCSEGGPDGGATGFVHELTVDLMRANEAFSNFSPAQAAPKPPR